MELGEEGALNSWELSTAFESDHKIRGDFYVKSQSHTPKSQKKSYHINFKDEKNDPEG